MIPTTSTAVSIVTYCILPLAMLARYGRNRQSAMEVATFACFAGAQVKTYWMYPLSSRFRENDLMQILVEVARAPNDHSPYREIDCQRRDDFHRSFLLRYSQIGVLVGPRLAERAGPRRRKACFFRRAQESRDRKAAAMRDKEQPFDAELLVHD